MVTNVGYGNRLRQNLIVELNHSYSRLNAHAADVRHGGRMASGKLCARLAALAGSVALRRYSRTTAHFFTPRKVGVKDKEYASL